MDQKKNNNIFGRKKNEKRLNVERKKNYFSKELTILFNLGLVFMTSFIYKKHKIRHNLEQNLRFNFNTKLEILEMAIQI